MPYTLFGDNVADSVEMQVILTVEQEPRTKLTFRQGMPKDLQLGHEGDWIGFGGNGIQFRANVIVLNKTGVIDFEIGFVQALTLNDTVANYQGEQQERSVRFAHETLPVRDGDPDDIWFKPDTVLTLTKLEEEGLVRAGDEVKAVFPTTYPRHPWPIRSVEIKRHFITALAVRIGTAAGAEDEPAPKTYFLDHVTWKCGYSGRRQDAKGSIGAGAGWYPNPDGPLFYTVLRVLPALPNFARPAGIVLDGKVANGTEVVKLT